MGLHLRIVRPAVLVLLRLAGAAMGNLRPVLHLHVFLGARIPKQLDAVISERNRLMPVDDHPVHPSTKIGQGHRYGCWNLPRTRKPYMVKDGHAPTKWPSETMQRWTKIEDTGSIECRYDLAVSDPHCSGCEHRGEK